MRGAGRVLVLGLGRRAVAVAMAAGDNHLAPGAPPVSGGNRSDRAWGRWAHGCAVEFAEVVDAAEVLAAEAELGREALQVDPLLRRERIVLGTAAF